MTEFKRDADAGRTNGRSRFSRSRRPRHTTGRPISTDPVGNRWRAPVPGQIAMEGSGAHFFSSIKVTSLRSAGVNFFANLANSHGSLTSNRT